jgi:predicted transcriptional regulator
MEGSAADFRTPDTVASEIGTDRASVEGELRELEARGLVRRPVRYVRGEENHYRLVARGYTRGEKLRILQQLLTRSSE